MAGGKSNYAKALGKPPSKASGITHGPQAPGEPSVGPYLARVGNQPADEL
jgi:hypothetical protein